MTRLWLGLAALTLVAACGVQGDLERPDPLWNNARAIQSECRRERAHHETLDQRCRQSMTVTPQTTAAPAPASPTAPGANGTATSPSPTPSPTTPNPAATSTTPTP